MAGSRATRARGAITENRWSQVRGKRLRDGRIDKGKTESHSGSRYYHHQGEQKGKRVKRCKNSVPREKKDSGGKETIEEKNKHYVTQS